MYYWSNAGKKSIMWMIYMMLTALAEYCFLALQIKIWRGDGQGYCMLDCLHALESPWNFGLFYLPITVWWILSDRKTYEYAAFVLQYKKREEIWKSLFWGTAVRTVLCSGIYGIIACLFSGFSSYEVMDWGTRSSRYYQINEMIYEGRVDAVLFSFFVFTAIKTLIAVMLLLLFDNYKKGFVLGYIFISALIILEWCFGDIHILLNLFTIAPQNFKYTGIIWGLGGIGVGMLFIIHLTGKSIWRKKEFYS